MISGEIIPLERMVKSEEGQDCFPIPAAVTKGPRGWGLRKVIKRWAENTSVKSILTGLSDSHPQTERKQRLRGACLGTGLVTVCGEQQVPPPLAVRQARGLRNLALKSTAFSNGTWNLGRVASTGLVSAV